MLGKIEGRMRRGHQRMRWLDSITDAMNRWWRIGRPGVLQSMGSQSQTWLGNWTTTTTMWSIQENIPCTLKKNICSVAFRWSALCIKFKTFWSFKASVSLPGFPCGSAGKESACYSEDLGSISGLGRSPGDGKGYPLQYSGLENSMDCIAHGVAKSQTWLSDFHFTSLSLLILSLNDLSINVNGMLQSPPIIVLLLFLLYIHEYLSYVFRCFYIGCMYIYNCYLFLLWSLNNNVVLFFVSYNSLYFKVYFVWFLLISICIEYFLSSPYFQSVWVWFWSESL